MNRPVLIALGTVFGLQSLRAFLPLLVYVLRDRFGLSSIELGGVGIAIFATGIAVPGILARRPHRPVATTLLALIVLRAALQFWTGDPVGSLALAALGIVMFIGFLAAVAGDSRPSGAMVGVALGLLLDTSVHALFGTRDLHWGGAAETAGAVALLLAGIASAVVALRRDRARESGFAASPAALLAWGPFLLLHLEVFGNVARFSSRTGLPTAHSGAMVALGLGISLALVGRAAFRPAPGRTGIGIACAGLLASLTGATIVGWLAWPLLVVGQSSAVFLLGAILRRPREAASIPRQRLALGGGWILFLILLFAHYAGYDLQLPGSRHGFFLAAAAVLCVAALPRSAAAASDSPDLTGRATTRFLLAAGVLLVALPLARSVPRQPSQPLDDTFRVISFNLHNGFDELGGCALRTMMSKLRASEPDVVALQEVSRGWVVNGSMDLYELSREALGMAGVPGPSVATDWGNAVFSRAPIESAVTRRLPPADLPLPRAITDVQITRRDGHSIRLLATHYHHVESDGPIREEHSRFVAEEFLAPAAWVLLGDFNDRPTSRCLSILTRAGWSDVVGGDEPAAVLTFPAETPKRRIDTILYGPGLVLRDTRVALPWGSDHRAVIAELGLAPH